MERFVSVAMISLLALYPGFSISQQYFYNDKYYDASWLIESGISIGAINALTDLGGRRGKGGIFLKDINLQNTKTSFAAQVGALYNYSFGFHLQYFQGTVSAQDSLLKNQQGVSQLRYQRNLHFKSTIKEFSALFEWHVFRTIKDLKYYSPYLTTGIGYFRFRPQAKLSNQWIDLQPLHTEGQGFYEYPERSNYSLQQFNIPVGIGILFELSAILNVRIEVVHRILLTDYLDDVSKNYIDPSLFTKYFSPEQARFALLLSDRRRELDPFILPNTGDKRGNPERNDSYFSINLKTSLILNRKRR